MMNVDQTEERLDARLAVAAGIQPQRSAADDHDLRESAKDAGVKAKRNCRYDNNGY